MHLVEQIDEVAALEIADPDKVAYVTQTTLSVDDSAGIIAALRERFPNLVGPKKSDICYATQNRQDAVRDLAARTDLVLVVGSVTSSNSNRLRELAERQGTPAYLIDGADDIQREWLGDGARVGLTAGASAPELLVEQVIQRLRDWGAADVQEQSGIRENVTFALPKELQRAAG
jgi:4-hydroxy-3-methylbut-2-enyl diphosphate reductase